MKRLYQIAVRNHQSQVATLIREVEDRNRGLQYNQAQTENQDLNEAQSPTGQYKPLELFRIENGLEG